MMRTIAPTQWCTFWVDDLYFGVPVDAVQEVLRPGDFTPVPTAAAEVVGLVNLRGNIVTVMELRTRLHLPARAADEPGINVVVYSRGEEVSLVVDTVDDITDFPELQVEPTPTRMTAPVRAITAGVVTFADKIMLILDPDIVGDVADDLEAAS